MVLLLNSEELLYSLKIKPCIFILFSVQYENVFKNKKKIKKNDGRTKWIVFKQFERT